MPLYGMAKVCNTVTVKNGFSLKAAQNSPIAKSWMLQQSSLEQNLVIQKKLARRTSCCHSFICSPGENFTCASWCLSLCYCFSYIIVPPTCCHSNRRRKRKDRGEKKQFQKLAKKTCGNYLGSVCFCLCLNLFLSIRLSEESYRVCRLHNHWPETLYI